MAITTAGQQQSVAQHNVICPSCGSHNREAAKFCCACGRALPAKTRIGAGPLKVTGELTLSWLGAEADFRPRFAWSPDGSHLAYTERGIGYPNGKPEPILDLFIVAANSPHMEFDPDEDRLLGSDCTEPYHADPTCAPVWSPDGRWVVYTSRSDGKLWIVGTGNDQQPRPLTWGQESVDRNPAWSPNGSHLLYQAHLSTAGRSELRLLNIHTHSIQRLAYGKHIAWSPDGKHFAAIGQSDGSWSSLALRVYALEGEEARLIAQPQRHTYSGNQLAWLDSERLLYHETWTGRIFSSAGVGCLDLRHDVLENVITGPFDFTLSPDRTYVAVTNMRSSIEDRFDVPIISSIVLIARNNYSLSELSSTLAQATVDAHVQHVHCFSPDSAKVLFQHGPELWLVNTNDTGLQSLTQGLSPQWSPDGRHIAFLRSPTQSCYELHVLRVEAA